MVEPRPDVQNAVKQAGGAPGERSEHHCRRRDRVSGRIVGSVVGMAPAESVRL